MEDDLDACMALAVSRNWGREEHKWRLLFEVGRVYGVDDAENGGLAGTVVATPYGRGNSAISMVLVAERYERQGLGGRLTAHAVKESGTAGACLTATEYGRVVYERLGFRGISKCVTYKGEVSRQPGAPRASSSCTPVTAADERDVLTLDEEAFGASRAVLYPRLFTFSEDFRVARDDNGTLLGFGGAWLNDTYLVIGPVAARDADTALGIVEALVSSPGMAGMTVRLDIDERHPELIKWAEDAGLKVAFTTTVMEYGEPVPGDPALLFLPVMQALG
ncbi:GNAT family N-acetyltransferase [Actinomadura adrarensis]|uniref:GNAT family N-acetyltransferase n=1 Tax=Actinomadura adrarensis TaxID=1819600 RepID=A0ABW3CNB0_9ACTN